MYVLEPDDPKQQRAVTTLGWKPRHAPPEEFKFVRDPQTGLFVPFVGLEEVGMGGEPDRSLQLLELIPADGIRTGALVELGTERLNVSERSIFRDLSKLERQGFTGKDDQGYVQRRKLN